MRAVGDVSIPVLILTLVGAGLQLGAMFATFVAAARAWAHTTAHIKKGLVLAGAMLVLDLPNRIVGALYTDISELLPMLPSQDNPVAALTGVVTGGVITLGLYGIMVPVALRAGGKHHAYPWLYGEQRDATGLILGVVGGLILGVASTLAFVALEVELGSLMEFTTELTPGLDREAPWFQWGVLLPAVCAAAVGEELLFRGVVQRWLDKWLGGTDAAGWIAIAVTALFWAILHAPNTTAPGIKIIQIGLIGLFFGWLARRHGVESAIAAHVSLNVGATALEFGLFH